MKDEDLMFLIHQQLQNSGFPVQWWGNSKEENYNTQLNEEHLVCSFTLKGSFPNHPVTTHEIHLF